MTWSCVFFILLLHECTTSKMYKATDDTEVVAKRRNKVIAWGNDDPCGRKMWVYMDGPEMKKAQTGCEAAFNNFVSLPPLEQNACLNAEKPKCLPLASCEGLFYGCMFLCEELSLTEGHKPKVGMYEQALFHSEQNLKHLKLIVKEFLDITAPKKRGPYKKKSKDGQGNRPPGPGSASGSGSKSKSRSGGVVL